MNQPTRQEYFLKNSFNTKKIRKKIQTIFAFNLTQEYLRLIFSKKKEKWEKIVDKENIRNIIKGQKNWNWVYCSEKHIQPPSEDRIQGHACEEWYHNEYGREKGNYVICVLIFDMNPRIYFYKIC